MSEIWPLIKQAKVAISYFIVDTETSMFGLLTASRKFTRPACRSTATAIGRYASRPTSAAHAPAAAAAVDRRDRQTRQVCTGTEFQSYPAHSRIFCIHPHPSPCTL